MGTSKKQKKREWLRYRDFVLSPYGVIKIKSLGYNSDKDKKMIFDYLLKNPASHLFSSDNIRCQGDYIYFNKPISLVRQGDDLLFISNPMEGRAISRVKIDARSGTGGEFRGETGMKVLRDKTLTFTMSGRSMPKNDRKSAT
ncbi:hypothetical protein [Symbiopectobacterium sp. RP]|uniref:hypothetical protein n=1 Tax=Symbiopectobacterium sp. RP TaxID=3248553 RepID=UPI003D294D00